MLSLRHRVLVFILFLNLFQIFVNSTILTNDTNITNTTTTKGEEINVKNDNKKEQKKEEIQEQQQEVVTQLQSKNATVKQTHTTKTIITTIENEIPKVRSYTEEVDITKPYCEPSLCEAFNGTHLLQELHTACQNNGSFGSACGQKPHLLVMSERRRNLILDIHNLARSRIASGQLEGYKPASHMPMLKWDNELEYIASLHVKRCEFAHDKCRNTERFQYSGQNIGYFWTGREFKSHSRRIKSFIIDWFREYKFANQTFINRYFLHPDAKIGHFTMMVSDRAHRVGCAAIRFHEPIQPEYTRFLLTCNYDFNNILNDQIYQSGPTASKCAYKVSDKFPALCDWKDAVTYDYDSEESAEEDLNILL